MEYLDLTRSSANIELDNTKHIQSTAYTMGFWFLSTDKDLGTNVFKVKYTDNMMITVTTDSNALQSHCFIGLEFYDIEGKTDTAANLKAFYESIDASNVNMAKSGAALAEKKWQHIRCSYSYDNMKFYLEINKEGFPTSDITPGTLNMPHYFRTKALSLPLRKISTSNPKLTISHMNTLTDRSVFIRNLVFMADYIDPTIHFHY